MSYSIPRLPLNIELETKPILKEANESPSGTRRIKGCKRGHPKPKHFNQHPIFARGQRQLSH